MSANLTGGTTTGDGTGTDGGWKPATFYHNTAQYCGNPSIGVEPDNTGAWGPSPNIMYFIPYYCTRGDELIQIRIDVSGSSPILSTPKLRIGLYANAGDRTPRPGAFIADFGEKDMTGATEAVYIVSRMLNHGTLYWFCVLGNSALFTTNATKLRSFTVSQVRPWGWTSFFNPVGGWSISQSYGALPLSLIH